MCVGTLVRTHTSPTQAAGEVEVEAMVWWRLRWMLKRRRKLKRSVTAAQNSSSKRRKAAAKRRKSGGGEEEAEADALGGGASDESKTKLVASLFIYSQQKLQE